MLFAVQSLSKKEIIDKRLPKKHSSAPMCDLSLMQELETLGREMLDQLTFRIREGTGLTSEICVKKATNSPYVRNWGLSNGRKNGITISF